jgi:hypothetical protein
LCTAAGSQSARKIIDDGVDGAIVAWADRRSGTNSDIYVNHVMGGGVLDPAWPANGRAVCTLARDQDGVILVEDDAGGAVIVWMDYRNSFDYNDLFAHHVLQSGVLDPSWPTDGRALCTAANYQDLPSIIADGGGGAIVTWRDWRSVGIGSSSTDIYAQHLLGDGTLDPAWPPDGLPLCTAAQSQGGATIIPDEADGAIVTWIDWRGGGADVFSQHVLAGGMVDPAWPVDGQALYTGPGNQVNLSSIPDGAGGAIVACDDSLFESDIHAQHVLANGELDAAWPTGGRAVCAATNGQFGPALVSDGAGGAIVTWWDARLGRDNTDIYAQHVQANGQLGNDVASVDGGTINALTLDTVYPNPSRSSVLTVRFTLASAGPATLTLFDASGRLCTVHDIGFLGAGRHSLNYPVGSLPAGLYFLRLKEGLNARMRRVVVIP